MTPILGTLASWGLYTCLCSPSAGLSPDTLWVHAPKQWFSTFPILGPFNTVPHIGETPNHKIIYIATS